MLTMKYVGPLEQYYGKVATVAVSALAPMVAMARFDGSRKWRELPMTDFKPAEGHSCDPWLEGYLAGAIIALVDPDFARKRVAEIERRKK